MQVEFGNGRGYRLECSRDEAEAILRLIKQRHKKLANSDTITEAGMKDKVIFTLMLEAFLDHTKECGTIWKDDA